MDFGSAIKSGFKNTFNYNGRASRSEFWWFYLFTILLVIAVFVLGGAIAGTMGGSDRSDTSNIIGAVIGILFLLYFLAIFFPTLSLIIRRLHDSDKSGFFLLLAFIPFGGIVLLVFYCLPGTVGPNKYGPDPLARPASVASVF